MLSTIMWIIVGVVGVVVFAIWVIYRITKAGFHAAKKHVNDSRRQKEQDLYDERLSNYIRSIDYTKVVAHRRVDDSSRKHHHETTFMVHMRDGSCIARTVVDGSAQYDLYVSKGLRSQV